METFKINNVLCIASINKYGISIHQWESLTPGNGNTTKALQILKKNFGKVDVLWIGSDENETTWQYWKHMATKGLIDHVVTDHGFCFKITH